MNINNYITNVLKSKFPGAFPSYCKSSSSLGQVLNKTN